MESQPQNPEFRNNPENFHPSTVKDNEDGATSLILCRSMGFFTILE